MESVFTNIYETREWGDNGNEFYLGSSGPGSNLEYNENTYIPFLKDFIKKNDIKSVVDLGCGDFKCGLYTYYDINVEYVGYDAYKTIVDYNQSKFPLPKFRFLHLDFCNKKEEIIGGDLCILKDVLQHWSLNDITSFMDYLVENKKFKYILIINCCTDAKDNIDIYNGQWRSLSCSCYPLKTYNPQKVYEYHTKEVSLITL
jgi:hypothetical protein